MGGFLLLVALCAIMAVASFLAGLVPLSISLSQSQLRIVSNIGVGILVGTSMIVIIPEGLGALVPSSAGSHGHSHFRRGLDSELSPRMPLSPMVGEELATVNPAVKPRGAQDDVAMADDTTGDVVDDGSGHGHEHSHDESAVDTPESHEEGAELPTFFIGFSMISGFVLMFLIDRLPKHIAESQWSAAPPREVRLDNLGVSSSSDSDEPDRLMGSQSEGPKQSRSASTTTGLVIHAAADGIAMGASSSTANTRLGFIVFIAIMIHKAPAAFGLTSVLLRQGLSKRAARGHLAIFSLAAPVGALATWFMIRLLGGGKLEGQDGQWWTGMLLLFSAGTFLYVAVHAMQDDGHSHGDAGMNGYADSLQQKAHGPQMWDTITTVGGMLLPLLTQIGHHH